jgi:hypothetical protein
MVARILLIAAAAALLLSAAAKKTVGTARGENQDLTLSVTLYSDPADVKQLIGDDLGGHYIVADVKIEPKSGKEVSIERDAFVLRTDKDGERARPFAASQITGTDVLVVTPVEDGKTARSSINLGGFGGGAGSSPEDDKGSLKTAMQHGPAKPDEPLRKTLSDRILVETKTGKPAGGLLYFPMEK